MSDLIEREAVLDAICDNCKFETDLERYMACSTCKDVEMIQAIPSARPKEGKWIEVTNGRGGHECSECHDYAPSYQSGAEHLSHFCPNCGADMREREGE